MRRPPRYRPRVDANQKEIVHALQAIGCSVETIGKPVDLLVGYRGQTFLLECKNPDTAYGRKAKPGTIVQRDFFRGWKGQLAIVSSPEEAIEVVSK